LGLTQQELGRRAKLSSSYISQLEASITPTPPLEPVIVTIGEVLEATEQHVDRWLVLCAGFAAPGSWQSSIGTAERTLLRSHEHDPQGTAPRCRERGCPLPERCDCRAVWIGRISRSLRETLAISDQFLQHNHLFDGLLVWRPSNGFRAPSIHLHDNWVRPAVL
jgi:hypothetical protein